MIIFQNAVYSESVSLNKIKDEYILTQEKTWITQDCYGQDRLERETETYFVIGWEVEGSTEPDYLHITFNCQKDIDSNILEIEIDILLEDLIPLINK